QPPFPNDAASLDVIVPVTPHDLWAVHGELSRFSNGQHTVSRFKVDNSRFGIGKRHANGTSWAVAIDGITVGHRAGLRQAIALCDPYPCETFKAVLHVRVQGTGTTQTNPKRTEVVSLDAWEISDLHKHHRDRRDHGDAVL